MKHSMVITAKNLFDSVADQPYEGYLLIEGNTITERKKGKPDRDVLDQADEVYCFDEELVMPGIVDTHTFFTGYAVFHLGADVSGVSDSEKGRQIIRKYAEARRPTGAIYIAVLIKIF